MTCPCGKHSACVPQCALMDYPGYTVDYVEDDGWRTAYPEMPYSPELPDVTRRLRTEDWVPFSVRNGYQTQEEWDNRGKDPAPVSKLVDEIDEWYAANDPLMAGAGDGNSPPWTPEKFVDGPDNITRPGHYARFAVEPITFIMMNDLPAWAANVVKYVCRAPHKHETEEEDIRKAIRYCEMRLELLKRRREGTVADCVGRPL